MGIIVDITDIWQLVSSAKCVVTVQSNPRGNIYFNDTATENGQLKFYPHIYEQYVQNEAADTYIKCDTAGVGTITLHIDEF